MSNLKKYREQISAIDAEVLSLLQERMSATHEIGIIKTEEWTNIYDPVREQEILEFIMGHFESDPKWIRSLWRELMYISKREQHHTKFWDTTRIRVGIQGGHGSFNERAIHTYMNGKPEIFSEKEIDIVYLYSTEWVLEALNNGEIEYGQFAIANSIGGMVDETLECIGQYRWKRVANYEIPISHSLMTLPDIRNEDIDCIMGHEQAVKQCEQTLRKYYGDIPRIGGTGNLISSSNIAEAIANGILPQTTASIGHHSLADIFGLQVVREHIEDRSDNRTTFILVTL
jgi:chorismate mutase / prephenate dehydratase